MRPVKSQICVHLSTRRYVSSEGANRYYSRVALSAGHEWEPGAALAVGGDGGGVGAGVGRLPAGAVAAAAHRAHAAPALAHRRAVPQEH